MTSTRDTDTRAVAMSDDERGAYLAARGWVNAGFGYMPPAESADIKHASRDGAVVISPSGIYSLSTAIREQLAREDQDATPDEFGRYYHGEEPDDAMGQRW